MTRLGVVGLAVVLATSCGLGGQPRGDALVPDLVPVPVDEFRTRPASDTVPAGLLFTGTVANLGSGPLLLSGRRHDENWQVDQRIRYSEAGEEVVPTSASVEYGGDNHEHWHIARVVVYHLETMTGDVVASDRKVGFCFFDFERLTSPPPGSPERGQFESDDCGDEADQSFEMGLSVGWVDKYPWWLDGQEIGISGLAAGRYRLVATVDPEGWFTESDKANNSVTSEIDLRYRDSDGAPIVTSVDVP